MRTTWGARPARVLLAVVALLLVTAGAGDSRGPALTRTVLTGTPPMGINNWNATGCSAAFTENYVRAEADALVRTGLAAAGYRYVNLDDCWAAPERDPRGWLVADPVRFPSGIAALADHVHRQGLLLGIYTSAGTHTCAAAGFQQDVRHRCSEWSATMALVAAGLGVSLVPRLSGLEDAPGAVLRPLAPPVPARHLFAACRSGAERHAAVAAVLEALVAVSHSAEPVAA